MATSLLFLSSACSLYAVLNKRGSGSSAGVPAGLVSQEQLVRRAASLCYLLSNEGSISLVSGGPSLPSVLINHLCDSESLVRL